MDHTAPTPAAALVVVDVQVGFDDLDHWGPTTNPACEENVAALVAHWRTTARPVVVVRHDSRERTSPLHRDRPGNALRAFLTDPEPDLLVSKHVNSAFYGSPDLDAWLRGRGVKEIVLCGIQTNMCVETTARMAGNLGYEVEVVLDATRTFDLSTTVPGIGDVRLTADEIMRASALTLQGGGFATMTTTSALTGRAG
ncbi:cysteine hydrolase family protein [Sanguibacter sp. 25GB23B1]|uniref:cysteine hydrolase family protein n=1 Tax=unclassified Sanguibacter TaxID=2645534 RepID=UPI0032B00CB2